MANAIRFRHAIYLISRQTKAPSLVLQETLATKYSELKLVTELPSDPHLMVICPHLLKGVQSQYPPPSADFLQYFGRGVSPVQINTLYKAKEAFIMEFAHPKENVWDGLKTADQLTEEMARKTGGLIWDEETRELFTPDAWHDKRLADWTESIPDIANQTIIHIYNNKGYARAISLGMSKVGLPDVVVDNFGWAHQDQMANLIDLFRQSMAEGAVFPASGNFKLNIRSLKNSELREKNLRSLKKNSLAMACLSLKPGVPDEGDPKNRIVRLAFDTYTGPDFHAQQQSMIDALFGSEDSVHAISHTKELLEASQKARAKLPELRQAFVHGLQAGEYIQVKAPFATPSGGREWMWVEVTNWNGNRIKGLLGNDPFEIPHMHAGQIVHVRQEDVFDYLRTYPDKHDEGNTTGQIIKTMEEASDNKPVRPEASAHPVMPPCEGK
jgi:uncharacterized protein YegJ (DUF2314 family)